MERLLRDALEDGQREPLLALIHEAHRRNDSELLRRCAQTARQHDHPALLSHAIYALLGPSRDLSRLVFRSPSLGMRPLSLEHLARTFLRASVQLELLEPVHIPLYWDAHRSAIARVSVDSTASTAFLHVLLSLMLGEAPGHRFQPQDVGRFRKAWPCPERAVVHSPRRGALIYNTLTGKCLPNPARVAFPVGQSRVFDVSSTHLALGYSGTKDDSGFYRALAIIELEKGGTVGQYDVQRPQGERQWKRAEQIEAARFVEGGIELVFDCGEALPTEPELWELDLAGPKELPAPNLTLPLPFIEAELRLPMPEPWVPSTTPPEMTVPRLAVPTVDALVAIRERPLWQLELGGEPDTLQPVLDRILGSIEPHLSWIHNGLGSFNSQAMRRPWPYDGEMARRLIERSLNWVGSAEPGVMLRSGTRDALDPQWSVTVQPGSLTLHTHVSEPESWLERLAGWVHHACVWGHLGYGVRPWNGWGLDNEARQTIALQISEVYDRHPEICRASGMRAAFEPFDWITVLECSKPEALERWLETLPGDTIIRRLQGAVLIQASHAPPTSNMPEPTRRHYQHVIEHLELYWASLGSSISCDTSSWDWVFDAAMLQQRRARRVRENSLWGTDTPF